ncbi:(d)CMP kinase [Methylomonas sp. MED-D]|uniref:Cytidylate kinase n=1 Tax=Methylomonas koyamae TaxID=702114 RepID=A0A177NPJ5_9GAMM|nr:MULTISPECIES: (d)CMP kinase [Methylomonas]MDT4328364.1 (d)CMP kinase [Methylomonas sp. MV1]OAI20008.1 cytidylate kinase [Methylomonas koyamae]
MTAPVLTIDGPSGAGKGTVSRAVAKLLGWNYLDSGSIYRSLAVAVLNAGLNLDDVPAICEVAQAMLLEFDCGDALIVKLNGVDITARLATETTGNTASIIAAYPDVRAVLLQKQKDFQQLPGLVADGRDMGSVVFSDARYKVYLTASAEERALRRYKQLIEKGIDANLPQITREIEERDRRDSQRTSAPLTVPEGALYIDSSNLTIQEVIDQVVNLVV